MVLKSHINLTRKILKCILSKRHYSSLVLNGNKQVLISKSNNVFENLAIEDWFYQNVDFEQHSLLFLWVNNPCVVIGRHQNPWVEVNLAKLAENSALLARRNSGGGTVYHDAGNLNCTFFTSRKKYDRKSNLEFICQILKTHWKLPVHVNKRDDIILNDLYKVSGTAAKLGNKNAYHHCTLLIDVNSQKLHETLEFSDIGIKSKATSSVKSKTINLQSYCKEMSVQELLYVIGSEYLKEESLGNSSLQYIDPWSQNYLGFEKILQSHKNWDWIFGKTPPFQVVLPITSTKSEIHLSVSKGRIEDASVLNSPRNFHFENTIPGLLREKNLDKTLYNFLVQNMPLLNHPENVKLKWGFHALCCTTL